MIATIYLPTTYNDGRPIPDEVGNALLAMADRLFGGYTLGPKSRGCYQGQRESVRLLTIVGSDKGSLLAYAKRIAYHLGQESVLMTLTDCEVHYV